MKFTDNKMPGSTFWKTVKPYLTNKGHHNGCDLQWSEGGRKMTDQKEVAETISNYFINVAVNIGSKIKTDCGYVKHPAVKKIEEIYHKINVLHSGTQTKMRWLKSYIH